MLRNILSMYREAYAGLPRNAWLLSLVHFVNRSGSMVLFFLSLYLTRKLGFTMAQAGQAVGAFGCGALAGSYLGGILCDRMGATAVQRLSLLLSGLNFIIMGYLGSFVLIVAAAFLQGVFAEALIPGNATAMARECPPAIRTKGFALNRLAANLGVTIGPVLGGYLAMWNYRALFWVDGLTSLGALVLFHVFFKSGPKPPPRQSRSSFPPAVTPPGRRHHLPAIFIMVFGLGLIFSQLFSTFPLFIHSAFGFAEYRIGQLLAINTVLIVLFEMVLLQGLKKVAPLKIIAVGALLTGLGFALTPLGRGFLYAAATVAVWTFGEMLSLPLLTAEIANRSHEGNRGRHMGWFGVSFSLAWMLGPIAGSSIYIQFSPMALWLSCGVLGAFLALGFRRLASGQAGPDR
ncbi:MAG: MFS transporter [Chrysiogenales bacterium]|nr:MAG: MFS transporter [Chrysiogenales bacterium]